MNQFSGNLYGFANLDICFNTIFYVRSIFFFF